MVDKLLDFDPAEQRPSDVLVGWKSLSVATGYSEDTLQRCCVALKIELPRWGRPSPTAPVFLPRVKVTILRRLIMGGF